MHVKIRNQSCALARVEAIANFQFSRGVIGSLREVRRELNDIQKFLRALQDEDTTEQDRKAEQIENEVDATESNWIDVPANSEGILTIQLDTASRFTNESLKLRSGKVKSIKISWPNGRVCP
jgi:hypothetical protein